MSKAEDTAIVGALVTSINRQFGKGAIVQLDTIDSTEEKVLVIPSGSKQLDAALGIGGYPRGRVVEMYGPADNGQSALALHAIANAQRAGGVCAFVDVEHAFEIADARACGVEVGKLLVSQPDTGEQAFDIVEVLARSGAVDLVVVDSIAAICMRAQIEGEQDHVDGLMARLMSQALRKLTAIASRTNTTILFVNALYERQLAGHVGTGAGTNALKFYASLRLDVRVVGSVNFNQANIGSRVRVKVAKNKLAAPFTEAAIELRNDGQIVDVNDGTAVDRRGVK